MNVLIAEDEAPAARRLERMVRESLGPRIGDLTVASTVEAASVALASSRVDLLLLDLNLNGADGFSLLTAAHRPPTIVVSAEFQPRHRCLRPRRHRLRRQAGLRRTPRHRARPRPRSLQSPRAPGLASLAVRSAGRIDLAAFTDIVALSGADDYVEVVLADGRRFLHDTSLQELERRLPPGFVRVHRSHIVNAAHVRSVRSLPGRRRALELAGGTEVPVSRSRAGAVSALLPRA